MSTEKGRLRLAAKAGVFVVCMVLALSVAATAFAANTAVFSSATPKPGSSTALGSPTISVVGYDKFGVKGVGAATMSVNGLPVSRSFSWFSGWGYRKFKMSYTPSSALHLGINTASVRVHDLQHKTSTYSWVFTVLDSTPPITTSDAELNYVGSPYTIELDAEDNVTVAHTYYKLDGGATIEYDGAIDVPAPGLIPQLHTLEFWSVDTAGNVEAHKLASFFVQVAKKTMAIWHQLPDLYCTETGCHGPSLDAIHINTRLYCSTCHNLQDEVTPTASCNAAAPCHGDLEHEHTVITSSSDPACTAVGCHGASAFSTAHATCATCHASTNTVVVAAIAGSADHCESCHGPTGGARFPNHETTSHDITVANSCVELDFCHTAPAPHVVGSAADFHPECANCHDNVDFQDRMVCNDCHDPIQTMHVGTSRHLTTNSCASGNAAGCHPTNVITIHSSTVGEVTTYNCGACHDNDAHDASTDCQVCHDVPPASHTSEPAHVLSSSGCWNPTCHSSNAAVIHGGGVKSARPGCADCHNSTTVASTTCLTCHPTLSATDAEDPHDVAWGSVPNVHHADLAPGDACTECHVQATGIISCATATCHDTVLGEVERSDGSTYIATDVYEEFDVGAASRHNVSEIGGGTEVGMKSRFDGGQGVELIDSLGNTVETTWGIPTVNVFWGRRDASAPVTAMKGLTADSVISCKDCHTGSDLDSAVGPHGAATELPIDPAYPAPFNMAVNSALTASGMKVRTVAPSDSATSTATLADAGLPGPNGVICAKCHDLYNVGTGISGGSNTAHGNGNHRDRVTGGADCVNCHIAVPHGWKRPRMLLDDTVDVAPYLDPAHRGRVVSGAFNHIALGPISALDDHSLDASGAAVWNSNMCVGCDDHYGTANLPAQFSLTATGTVVQWIAVKGPNYGIASIKFDTEATTTVDLYAATETTGFVAFDASGLADTTHTLVVTVTGTKNAASTSYGITYDAFNLNKGQIQDPTSRSGGSWTSVTNNTKYLGNNMRYSVGVGWKGLNFTGYLGTLK